MTGTIQATLIVDKLHLHLLPSMNPDGFAAKPNPMRNNAQNVDLNRDFPDQVCYPTYYLIQVHVFLHYIFLTSSMP